MADNIPKQRAITDEIPKSRLTLTYRTQVHGEPEDVQLPLRILIMGDLSGTDPDGNPISKDRKLELEKRHLRQLGLSTDGSKGGTNLDKVMEDMDLSVTVNVQNKIDPDRGGGDFTATIPIKGMKSFQPAEVAKHVPKIRSLLLLKKLLLEVQANIDNRKEFRLLLREMAAHPEKVDALLAELGKFEDFKVPADAVAAAKAEREAHKKGGKPAAQQ